MDHSHVRRVRNQSTESVHYGASPDSLPPIDVPLETEPAHYGRSWREGPRIPRRARKESSAGVIAVMIFFVLLMLGFAYFVKAATA